MAYTLLGGAAGAFFTSTVAVGITVGLMRVVAALGVGVVVFTGFEAAFDAVADVVSSGQALGGVPADMLAVMTLGGIPQGIGIILGAYTTRMTLVLTASLTRLRFGQ